MDWDQVDIEAAIAVMDLATKYLSMKSYQRNPLVSMEGSLDTIF
jgi:hypothetical protein